MISGRALGHTGGTLDKLEAIPGYQVGIEPQRFRAIVEEVGCSIAGASDDIVPADRRIYALRDVSGIVESPPLIVSSILSKKAAARLSGLALDVKVGSGGFMPTEAAARQLAELLVAAGTDLGIRVEALLTWMGDPLGRTVGNALEVVESIRFLRGEEIAEDLEEVTIELACAMLRVAGEGDGDHLRSRVVEAWRSGAALQKLAAMIEAHGGDPRVTENLALLPSAAKHPPRARGEGGVGRGNRCPRRRGTRDRHGWRKAANRGCHRSPGWRRSPRAEGNTDPDRRPAGRTPPGRGGRRRSNSTAACAPHSGSRRRIPSDRPVILDRLTPSS